MSIKTLAEEWQRLTVSAQLYLSKNEHDQANIVTGSLFYVPILNIFYSNQNYGIVPLTQGHTTTFTDTIIEAIKAFMTHCPYQVRLAKTKKEIKETRIELKGDTKLADYATSESRMK